MIRTAMPGSNRPFRFVDSQGDSPPFVAPCNLQLACDFQRAHKAPLAAKEEGDSSEAPPGLEA